MLESRGHTRFTHETTPRLGLPGQAASQPFQGNASTQFGVIGTPNRSKTATSVFRDQAIAAQLRTGRQSLIACSGTGRLESITDGLE